MRLFAIALPPSIVPDVFDALLLHLEPAAQDRVRRFRRPEDANRSLVGRLAPVWYLRSSGLIKPNEKVEFGSGKKGKPTIVQPDLQPRIEFNVSHDGRYVLLGISEGEGEIGVDVMAVPKGEEGLAGLEEGLSHQMTITEKQNLSTLSSTAQRTRALTTLWTIKECYTKAIGEGIVFGMERIAVTLTCNASDDGEGEAELEPRSVRVDGKDLRELGWGLQCGWLGPGQGPNGEEGQQGGEGEAYRWVVIHRAGQGIDSEGTIIGGCSIEVVDWKAFASIFDTMHS